MAQGDGTKYIEGGLNVSKDIQATGSITSVNNPLEVTANRVTSVSSSSDNSHYPTAKAVWDAIRSEINGLPEAMVFKGTVGDSGTVTWANLPQPAAASTQGAGTEGHAYKVITAYTNSGSSDYKPTCKVGDIIISTATEWVVVPSGDEPSGTVTNVATGAGLTGGPITTSGTIKANLNSEASIGTIGSNKVYAVGVDANGKLAVNVPWQNDNTATATDDILDGSNSGTAIKYSPYTSKGAGHLYKHIDNPSDTTNHLKYDGKFSATEVYAGSTKLTGNTGTITKVKTTAGTHSAIEISSGDVSFNVPTKTSHLTNDSGYLTSESDTLGTVLNRGNSATTDINFNQKDWYNAGVQKTAYNYNTNQNPSTQYYWFKITPPTSNGTDRYFLCVENDVNYPTYRGTYVLDISNYNNGSSYNVSLNNLGSTAPASSGTAHLLNVAVDASGNVYVQARATWTSYLRFIRTGGTTTQTYPYASGSADTSKAAFGTIAGFTALGWGTNSATKYIQDTGCIRVTGGAVDTNTGRTGKTNLFVDTIIEDGTALNSKYQAKDVHPTITMAAGGDTTTTPAQLGYSGTFTAVTGVTRDSNGHVTTLNTATYTLPANSNSHNSHKINSGKNTVNADIMSATASSGDIILGDSGATAGSYGNSADQTPGYGATFNVPYITVNAKGIVTSISNKTVKIPASDEQNTASAANNILAGSNSGTQITYQPYAAATANSTWVATAGNAGKLYSGTEKPVKDTRLNYNGYLYATKMYVPNGNTYTELTGNLGTVTGVTAGAGLNTTSNDTATDGGTISTSGTLYLTKSGVTAGTYQGITVDKYGRVTAASNAGYVTSSGVTSVATSGTGLSGGTITSTGTITLDSSSAGTAAANKVLLRNDTGSIKSAKYAIVQSTSTDTIKATMQYNVTEDCIEFIFA